MRPAKIKAPIVPMIPRKYTRQHSAKLVSSGGTPKGLELKIRLRSKTLKTLASQKGSMKALIETYSAAVVKSRLLGKSVRFVGRIGPGIEPNFRLETGSPQKGEATNEHNGDLGSALTAARERGQALVTHILNGSDMLTAEEFARLVGTSRVTVNSKRQNHQILGLEGAKRGFRFPRWQIGEDGKPFSALPALFDHLGGSPWAVYRFLVQHHPELEGLTGREALYRGLVTEALGVAESVVRAAT
jgi:hypothetical protein